MAGLSNSDKQNLTKEQQAQVAALKEQYAQAQKSGDTAAMEKAHADAEKIRSSAGYSGGTSGSGSPASSPADRRQTRASGLRRQASGASTTLNVAAGLKTFPTSAYTW